MKPRVRGRGCEQKSNDRIQDFHAAANALFAKQLMQYL